MAKKTVLVCDLCGGVEAHAHRISVDGESFELDLCAQDAAVLEKMRKAALTTVKDSQASAATQVRFLPPSTDTRTIREWALENGYEVAAKGKIPTDVLMAYQRAHR